MKWISVEDDRPEEGTWVIMFASEYGLSKDFMVINAFFFELSIPQGITHWMPLPNPPQREIKKECQVNEDGAFTILDDGVYSSGGKRVVSFLNAPKE